DKNSHTPADPATGQTPAGSDQREALPPPVALTSAQQKEIAVEIENRIGRAGVGSPIRYKEQNGKVTVLSLVDSVTTDEHLSAIDGMTDLETLLLSRTKITGE